MATLLTQRNQALFAALDRVEFNGQAAVVALRALQDGKAAVVSLRSSAFDPAAANAAEMVANAMADVERYGKTMTGLGDAPVSVPSWKELRRAIGRLYSNLWAVEDVLPPHQRETFASAAVYIGAAAVAAFPEVTKKVIEGAGDLAAAAGAGASNALAEILKGLWPLLLVIGVAGAGALVLVPRMKAGGL
jgi:hypothetical protein